jgi:hypothetical protein
VNLQENTTSELTGQKPINPNTGKHKYYKDKPEAVRKRDALRMYVNGREVSKKHPLYKAGRYKTFEDAAFSSLQNYELSSEGSVYIITNPAWPEWIKVGMAVDASDRCSSYQTSSPFRDYEVIHSFQTEDRRKAEREAHDLIEQHAVERRGEWFKIQPEKAIHLFNTIH